MKCLVLVELFYLLFSFGRWDLCIYNCKACEVAIQGSKPCTWNEVCTVSAVIGECILLFWPYPLSREIEKFYLFCLKVLLYMKSAVISHTLIRFLAYLFSAFCSRLWKGKPLLIFSGICIINILKWRTKHVNWFFFFFTVKRTFLP